jgi:hypothetical protein
MIHALLRIRRKINMAALLLFGPHYLHSSAVLPTEALIFDNEPAAVSSGFLLEPEQVSRMKIQLIALGV